MRIARFSEICASETPNFRLFRLVKVILKVHDESNRMVFVPSKSAGYFSKSEGAESPPPHQLTYSRMPTSNRVNFMQVHDKKKNRARDVTRWRCSDRHNIFMDPSDEYVILVYLEGNSSLVSMIPLDPNGKHISYSLSLAS